MRLAGNRWMLVALLAIVAVVPPAHGVQSEDRLLVPLGSLDNHLISRAGGFGGAARDAWGNPILYCGSDPTNDLLIVDGIAYRSPATQSELLRRAIVEMYSIGTACESFAVDNNLYPGPVEPTDAVARIEPDLVRTYIHVLPNVDPWGNPYLFWSDTLHYGIVSYGPDGIPDYLYANWGLPDFQALHTGPTIRFGQDLVFVKGAFVQWPAIEPRP